jgi:hypothetical protein
VGGRGKRAAVAREYRSPSLLLIKSPDGVGEVRPGDRQTPPSLIMEGGQPWRDAQASQAVRVEDTNCRLPASYAKERYRPRRALLSSF